MPPHWQQVVYTSLPCIFTPVPEWIMSLQYRAAENKVNPRIAVMVLAAARVAMLWAGILIWHDGTYRNTGIAFTLLSFGLLSFSYVLVTIGANTKRTGLQNQLLWFTLVTPDTNWIFDLGGSRAPGLRLAHFVVVTLNVFAALIGLYMYFVADELHAAYNCYPRHVSWVDYKYGLCPEFTGSPQTSYVCRHFDDTWSNCGDPNPPPTSHKPIFATVVHTSVIIYLFSALEKYESYQ